MDKALAKVSLFLGERAAQIFRKHFERVQKLQGTSRLFKRIASASDREQLEDYLAEIRFALIFVGLGFQVEIEPSGSKGPDLGISRDGHSAIVEIMRFRKVYPGPPVLDLSDEHPVLPEYGNPPRDIRKAFEKILAKFPQVGDQQGVIAIWNDDEDLEDVEVEIAVINVRNDAIRKRISLPSGLLFVLYGSRWVGINDKQLHCFPVCYPTEPYQLTWQTELDTSTVNGSIQRALTQTGASVV